MTLFNIEQYFECVLVISTAHITLDTNALLSKVSEDSFPIRVVPHAYGYILFVGTDFDDNDPEWKEVPSELKAIIRHAINNGCTHVNIDRDAVTIKELPTFEW